MDLFGIELINYRIMKIILSGGWGYFNLGDDAILLATLANIYRIYPHAEIIVMSTNINETLSILLKDYSNVRVVPSFHTILSGSISINQLYPLETSLLEKLLIKGSNRLLSFFRKLSAMHKYNRKEVFMSLIDSYFPFFNQIFCNCDMYIMSGGGYLNDWIDLSISKYFEVLYVRKFHKKVFIVGQTIGPFSNLFARKIVKEIIDCSSFIAFRDEESYQEFSSYLSMKILMPDIALSSPSCISKEPQIVFIPFNREILECIDLITMNLKILCKNTSCKRIILTVSQLWAWAIEYTYKIYFKLIKLGVSVEVLIPKNVLELQELLGKSSLVISQNLHGLIMGYRAGVPVISLNTRRKFKTFMKQIDCEECMVAPHDIDSGTCFLQLYKISIKKRNKTEGLQKEVYRIFNKILIEQNDKENERTN